MQLLKVSVRTLVDGDVIEKRFPIPLRVCERLPLKLNQVDIARRADVSLGDITHSRTGNWREREREREKERERERERC